MNYVVDNDVNNDDDDGNDDDGNDNDDDDYYDGHPLNPMLMFFWLSYFSVIKFELSAGPLDTVRNRHNLAAGLSWHICCWG